MIKQVGNYGEIWDRDITPMGVPRGINKHLAKRRSECAPPIR